MGEPPRVVIWYDPGKTTGYALYNLDTDSFASGQYGENDEMMIPRLRDLASLVYSPEEVAVGYEKYLTVGGPRGGSPKHSLPVIGRIEEAVRECGYTMLPSQPSSARMLGGPVMLRRMGWYKPGQPHANDAAMHTLAMLMKIKPMPYAVRKKLFPGYTPGATISASAEAEELGM
jgi:hypothetical protein